MGLRLRFSERQYRNMVKTTRVAKGTSAMLILDGVNEPMDVLDSNSIDLTAGLTFSLGYSNRDQSNFTAATLKNSASDHVLSLWSSGVAIAVTQDHLRVRLYQE